MPSHAERRVLDYTPEQLYALVAAVDRYPEFLPWCIAARITGRSQDAAGLEVLMADMVIGFKMFRERFTSKVTLDPAKHTIHVAYVTGPMKYMTNRWEFLPVAGGRCEVDFFVDFEFRSRLLQKTIELLFHEAVKRMVTAFEARARQLYRSAPGP